MSASSLAGGTQPAFTAAPWRERAEEALIPPLVALLVALICGDLLILSYGQSPAAVYRLLLEGTWGNAYGFGQVLYKATTLTCTGLAVAVSLGKPGRAPVRALDAARREPGMTGRRFPCRQRGLLVGRRSVRRRAFTAELAVHPPDDRVVRQNVCAILPQTILSSHQGHGGPGGTNTGGTNRGPGW